MKLLALEIRNAIADYDNGRLTGTEFSEELKCLLAYHEEDNVWSRNVTK